MRTTHSPAEGVTEHRQGHRGSSPPSSAKPLNSDIALLHRRFVKWRPTILFSSPAPAAWAARSSTTAHPGRAGAVMVRRDDERAAELRALGAEVVIGDLTRPETVAAALQGVVADVLRDARVTGPSAGGDRGGHRGAGVREAGRPGGHVADDGVADDRHQHRGVAPAAAALAGGAGTQLVRPAGGAHPADGRSWTIRCSPRWRRGRSRRTARSRCRSAPDAPRRSPWTTSPGSSPPCCATRRRTSDTSTS